ncbi:conjugal transfer protein TraN (plasmid) [Salmonella enterica subsp. enterica]
MVQQQGRNGQLRISFGSAKHPDCRGLRLMSCRKFSSTDWISLTSTKT